MLRRPTPFERRFLDGLPLTEDGALRAGAHPRKQRLSNSVHPLSPSRTSSEVAFGCILDALVAAPSFSAADLDEGSPLHVDVYGSGPDVVLLHGTPSSPSDFHALAAVLARRRRVLVPHLPGYGLTPASRIAGSMEATVRALERRLLDLGVTEADMVAFSGGAYKAVALALSGKVTIGKMVLFAPQVGLDEPARRAYRDLSAAAFAGKFDPRPTWLDRMGSPGLATSDPVTAARVLAWLDAAPMSVLCAELVAFADAADLRPRLKELSCPVLVCAGTADNAVPFASAEELARLARHGVLERIEGRGHALLLELPARAERLVCDALAVELREA